MTDNLLALAEKATPGPWTRAEEWPLWVMSEAGEKVASCVYSGDENAAYIAACSPDGIAQMCRALIAAEKMRDRGYFVSGTGPDFDAELAKLKELQP